MFENPKRERAKPQIDGIVIVIGRQNEVNIGSW